MSSIINLVVVSVLLSSGVLAVSGLVLVLFMIPEQDGGRLYNLEG